MTVNNNSLLGNLNDCDDDVSVSFSGNLATSNSGINLVSTTPLTWKSLSTSFACEDSSLTPFEVFISALNQDEIDSLVEKVISRTNSAYDKKKFISSVIRYRHMSEKFLMKYWEYIDRFDLLVLHRGDIVSGEYSEIALLLELK